jgi:hypothetical protein
MKNFKFTMRLLMVITLSLMCVNLYSGRGGGSHSSSSHSSSHVSSSHSASHSSTEHISGHASVKSNYSVKTIRTSSGRYVSVRNYKTPSGKTVIYTAYRPVRVIYVNEYHYYHSSNSWLWWYLIYNYHTHRQDTIRANTKQELDNKVKNVSASESY